MALGLSILLELQARELRGGRCKEDGRRVALFKADQHVSKAKAEQMDKIGC